ncbi:MAG: hypothetical protein ABIH72_02420 [archaeon]
MNDEYTPQICAYMQEAPKATDEFLNQLGGPCKIAALHVDSLGRVSIGVYGEVTRHYDPVITSSNKVPEGMTAEQVLRAEFEAFPEGLQKELILIDGEKIIEEKLELVIDKGITREDK